MEASTSNRILAFCFALSLCSVCPIKAEIFDSYTTLTTGNLATIQLEFEKLIVSKWTAWPTVVTIGPSAKSSDTACYTAMTSTSQSSMTSLAGCCRVIGVNSASKYDQGRASVLGALVRLGFHDAAPFDVKTNTGRPNGCIDFNDPDNAGLQTVVGQIATIQTNLKNAGIKVSLADLYQYGGLVATWCAVPYLPAGSTTVVPFTFKYGRKDSLSCPYTSDIGHLPDSEKSYGEVYALVETRWGMKFWQMAALMGAHALGNTRVVDSGYSTSKPLGNGAGYGGGGVQGSWAAKNAVLDGQSFYNLMLGFIWLRQSETHNGKTRHSFAAEGTIMTQLLLLNTDVAILWDAGDDTTINTRTCSVKGNTGGSTLGYTGVLAGVLASTSTECYTMVAGKCPMMSWSGNPCVITNKKDAGGSAIVDLLSLVMAYGNTTSTSTQSVFQSTSNVGMDTWFPDFVSSYIQMGQLGYTTLCSPGTTCNPNSLIQSAPAQTWKEQVQDSWDEWTK